MSWTLAGGDAGRGATSLTKAHKQWVGWCGPTPQGPVGLENRVLVGDEGTGKMHSRQSV